MKNVKLHDYELYVNLNRTFLNLNIYTLVLFSQNFPTWQRKKRGLESPQRIYFTCMHNIHISTYTC